MTAVFVYGLLKPGFSLHHVIAPYVVRSAPGRARGRLYDSGVPAARFGGDGEIEGVVLWIDPERAGEALAKLDDLEDEGEVYRRVVVDTDTAEGVVSAFSYEYLPTVEGRRDVGSAWRQ